MQVHAFTDLDAVAANARGALDRARQASLFDRLDWFRLTLAHCPPRGHPLVLRAGGTWLFLVRDGGTLRPLASWYTLRFAPVGTASADEMTAIARHLRRCAAHVILEPLDGRCHQLASAFAAAGWLSASSHATVNWQVSVSGWACYWAARPSRLRRTVQRRSRASTLRLVIHGHFEANAWSDYEAVYARSWKPAEGAPAFLRALALQEGHAGTLRLGLAYDGDRPVAAQLWLVENGTATIHKLAHDNSDKAASPGTLLTHAMFHHVIEVDRVARLDFGTGDDAYKADWMDDARPLWRLDLWNPRRPVGLLLYARHRLAKLVHRPHSR